MMWTYIERERFIRMCEKEDVSSKVLDAIKSWAPSVSRIETSRTKLVYRSSLNHYEVWSARIPNPNSNKGKRGGYRLVYFLDTVEGTINLDFIDERKNMGYQNEGKKKKDKYNQYIEELKEEIKKMELNI